MPVGPRAEWNPDERVSWRPPSLRRVEQAEQPGAGPPMIGAAMRLAVERRLAADSLRLVDRTEKIRLEAANRLTPVDQRAASVNRAGEACSRTASRQVWSGCSQPDRLAGFPRAVSLAAARQRHGRTDHHRQAYRPRQRRAADSHRVAILASQRHFPADCCVRAICSTSFNRVRAVSCLGRHLLGPGSGLMRRSVPLRGEPIPVGGTRERAVDPPAVPSLLAEFSGGHWAG